jgi:hypothetical protein
MSQPAPEPSEQTPAVVVRGKSNRARVQAWRNWLSVAMEHSTMGRAELAQRGRGNISHGMSAALLHAGAIPPPETVLAIAATLHAPGLEALAAAGYGGLVEQIRARLQHDNPIGYGGGMTDPGAFEPTLDGVLAAIAGLGERMESGFASVHAKIDNVNADIEVLSTLAHKHERELDELSKRFDRNATRVDRRFDRVDAEFGQVRADIAALKTETALVESAVEAVAESVQRHLEDPTPHAG